MRVVHDLAKEKSIEITDHIGRFTYPLKKGDKIATLHIYPHWDGGEDEWQIILRRDNLADFDKIAKDTSEIPSAIEKVLAEF